MIILKKKEKEYRLGFFIRDRNYLKIYYELFKILSLSKEKIMVLIKDFDLLEDLRNCLDFDPKFICFFLINNQTQKKDYLENCIAYFHEGVGIDMKLFNYLNNKKTKVIYSGLHWLDSLAFAPSLQKKYDMLLYPSKKIFFKHNEIIKRLSPNKRSYENNCLDEIEKKINFVGTPLFDNWHKKDVFNKKARKNFVIFSNDPSAAIGKINSLCLFSDWNLITRAVFSILNLELKCLPQIINNHSTENIFGLLKEIAENKKLKILIKTRNKHRANSYRRIFDKYKLDLICEPTNILDYRSWMRKNLYEAKLSFSLRACSFSAIDSILAGVKHFSFNNFYLDFRDYLKIDNYMFFYNKTYRNINKKTSFWNYKNIVLNERWNQKFKLNGLDFNQEERNNYFEDFWGFQPAEDNRYSKLIINKVLEKY